MMPMHRFVAACSGGIALVFTACGERSRARGSEHSASSVTAAGSDSLTVKGIWSDSLSAEADYVATYVNRTLVFIHEEMRFADGMRSTRTYHYDGAQRLTHITEQRSLTAASGNSSPTLISARSDVYLSDGRIDSTRKTVDGAQKELQPYDIDNLRQHERRIASRVPTTYTAP